MISDTCHEHYCNHYDEGLKIHVNFIAFLFQIFFLCLFLISLCIFLSHFIILMICTYKMPTIFFFPFGITIFGIQEEFRVFPFICSAKFSFYCKERLLEGENVSDFL